MKKFIFGCACYEKKTLFRIQGVMEHRKLLKEEGVKFYKNLIPSHM